MPLTDCVTSFKISDDLRWYRHIANVVAATNKILCFLNSKLRYLTNSIKRLLASQLVFPGFDYACAVFLDPGGEPTLLENRLVRIYDMLTPEKYSIFQRICREAVRLEVHAVWHSFGVFHARKSSNGSSLRIYDVDDIQKICD